MALFGSGLLGLAGVLRHQMKAQRQAADKKASAQ
jgi:hypothetical protein